MCGCPGNIATGILKKENKLVSAIKTKVTIWFAIEDIKGKKLI